MSNIIGDKYYIFVLGYDLLQEYLKKKQLACDQAMEFCQSVYNDFLKSGYNDDTNSTYDNLQIYINEHY